MNILYAKTVLYAYPNVDAVIEQINELVEKKALSSMVDFSPCEEQCERILNLSRQKFFLMDMKRICEDALSRFTDEEKDCFDYKYFHKKPKGYFNDFDFQSRDYFRKQIKLAEKFALRLEKRGLDDKKFEEELLSIEFMRELLRRVKEHEDSCKKNKSAKEKKEKLKELPQMLKVGEEKVISA